MLKPYAVNDLVPGMMVARVIEQSGPVKIRKVGMIRSPDMIKGLMEMGVSLVEVDLSQSLDVDPQGHEPENLSAPTETKSATPTQRLVASNKRIADVDRQLSQQFHHSLFLPAVDQMPSKWQLYGKPYGLLALCVVLGFSIGFGSTRIPGLLSSSGVVTDTKAMQSAPRVDDTTGQGNQDKANSTELVTSDTNNGDQSVAVPANESNDKSASTNANASATQMTDVDNRTTQPSVNVLPPVVEASATPTQQGQLVSRNGVLVEEGQQVLGYQAPERETDVALESFNTSATANNADVESNIGNAELLRRIQEAADEIDNRPLNETPEPIRVTDFNDVQRIDQLPPSLLTQMPSMSFSAHMFASKNVDRWVRVNSRRVSEGEFITNDLQLVSIEPERVILEFKGERFSMNALSDW